MLAYTCCGHRLSKPWKVVFWPHHTLMLFVLQYECEDILGDAALFDALGVGLGRAEMMDVALAVKKLGEDPRKGVATVSH